MLPCRAVIHSLSQPFASRWGAPVVDRVDAAIFARRYFMNCLSCTYCHDSCCQYGADIDVDNVPRVEKYADELERFTGVPRDRWWLGGADVEWTDDREFPGGRQTRTRVEGGACVFLSRVGRGCMLHAFAIGRGIDYHEIKPMVCSLFPVTFDGGLLHPSNEIQDRSLQCIDDGPTLYQGVRSEIDWYFGPRLVLELDELERGLLAGKPGPK
jgi:Fe-S-cluster containining protein